MSRFLVDPNAVSDFMEKSYNLRAAWDKIAQTPEGILPPPADEQIYDAAQRQHIRDEAVRLYDAQVARLGAPSGVKKRFVLSAGAPGAGKTTLLEDLVKNDAKMKGLLFVDPDERALKLMPSYYADMDKFTQDFNSPLVGLALSYTKWRWGSNWISNTMMNRAADEGRDILLGTTATSPFMSVLYDNAHALGYASDTLIVCAPDAVRQESARRRFEDEGTRFTNDTREKGVAFYERLPTLLAHTQQFNLYWRDDAGGAPVLAAFGKQGRVVVTDGPAMQTLMMDLTQVSEGKLVWRNLMATYMQKFRPQKNARLKL